MKFNVCPECECEDLGDRWVADRKLQQYCRDQDCHWKGEARIPEQQEIETKKVVPANHFSGFQYTLFDKYGHVTTLSRSYGTEAEALKEMQEDMERSNRPEHAYNGSSCTGVLWPSVVTVHGKKFVFKDNKVKRDYGDLSGI